MCHYQICTVLARQQECARVTRAASLRDAADAAPASSFAMRLLIRRCHSSSLSLHLLNEQREGDGWGEPSGEQGRVAGQISFSPSLTRMHSKHHTRTAERQNQTRKVACTRACAEPRYRFQPSRRGLGDMTRQRQRGRESATLRQIANYNYQLLEVHYSRAIILT